MGIEQEIKDLLIQVGDPVPVQIDAEPLTWVVPCYLINNPFTGVFGIPRHLVLVIAFVGLVETVRNSSRPLIKIDDPNQAFKGTSHLMVVDPFLDTRDRKSTRLNSSHVKISHAVL